MTTDTTPNDNRIVQGLWIDGRLTELERLCIRSFCHNGHEFHLYHYDELSNLPNAEGLRLMDAGDILPSSEVFYHHKNKSPAGFADRFRWELMRQKGGWYADMDVVCLRPLDFDNPIVMGYEHENGSINSALMKFPCGHPAAAALADACGASINKIMPWDTPRRKRRKIKRALLFRNDPKYMKWGEAGGPIGTTLAINHFGLTDCVMPLHALYVQFHPLTNHFFDDTLNQFGVLEMMLSSTYSLHIVNSNFAKDGIDKDATFPPNSPYETLKRRYPEQ